MVSMAESAANWRKTYTHVDRTHSLTHLQQHSYNHEVWIASSAIRAKDEITVPIALSAFRILFWRYLREREQAGVSGKKPPENLPANRYDILEK